ncbi:uncharacterized protein [Parasteatoda tepidariorum]|uniref:uncharacterized protein n=1 Tax=Parasteatoda tepidariorum TaxID=114398 RepID=UPI0039BCD2EA
MSTKLVAEYPQYASELTCEKLQKKFSNLKTIFQRNLKKVKTLTSGAGYEGACPWVHFNALKFLVDAEDCEESFSNLEENDSLILSQNVEQSNDPLDSITFACSYTQDIVEDHKDYLEQEIMNENDEQ